MTRISYTVQQACDATGLGKTSLYALTRDGTLEIRKVGRRTLITARSLQQFIEGKAA